MVIIALMVGVSVVAIIKLDDIRDDLENIYNHPFAVSNAARAIQFEVSSMHRDMKDVVLARSDQELDAAIQKVAANEEQALDQFDLISERFLGDKSQVNRTYKTFIDWKPIRDHVIALTRAGRVEDAIAITKGKGAQHVEKLTQSVSALVTFAHNKADEFQARSHENERQAIILVASLAALALTISAFIAFYVVRTLHTTFKDALKRDHLIDQNIMFATLDLDGHVLDATNALCRFIGVTKTDLIGTPSGFFDNSDEMDDTQVSIWKTVRTGKPWTGEIKRVGIDGHLHWARSSVIPDFDDTMTLSGYTNILEDTTSKRLSGMDKLTELYNRRRYEEIIRREIRLAKRHDTPLCLAIIDIDYFKKYNDFYGHPKGDVALANVAAELLQSIKRPNDYAFRIGGEEFALVFSDLDEKSAAEFLDKVRLSIEGLDIAHEPSDVSDHLTISIGAFVARPGTSVTDSELYGFADKALYEAKHDRNSVVVHS